MGAEVSSFFSDIGDSLKVVWEETQRTFIRPVLGESISNALGVEPETDWEKERRKAMADGGAVDGEKGVKVIDTPAQLIALIKKFPEEAKSNGLSVGMVKDAVKSMARGGVAIKGRGGMAKGGIVPEWKYLVGQDVRVPFSDEERQLRMAYGGMVKGAWWPWSRDEKVRDIEEALRQEGRMADGGVIHKGPPQRPWWRYLPWMPQTEEMRQDSARAYERMEQERAARRGHMGAMAHGGRVHRPGQPPSAF